MSDQKSFCGPSRRKKKLTELKVIIFTQLFSIYDHKMTILNQYFLKLPIKKKRTSLFKILSHS